MLTLSSLKLQMPSVANPRLGNPFVNGKQASETAAKAAETSSQMIEEMEAMRNSTEVAAINIGLLLERIVNLATEGNREVQETLADAVGLGVDDDSNDSASINDLVLQQVDVVNGFMSHVRSFLAEQVELAQQANEACETISRSATDVAELTKTSQVLSINLRIEAARLGDEGSSFTALGQEVHSFSAAVREAADEISNSVGNFMQTIPRIREKAIEMETGVSELSQNFQTEMSALSERTGKMHDSLKRTLDQVEFKNNEILDCSNETLSHLAFQDPVSQGLQRVQHNVSQLQSVINGQSPDFISLSQLREDVGEDGRTERKAGEVDLF
jgi:hypothetical protein